MNDKPLFVKELIRQVHRELAESQDEREQNGENSLFQVQKLTIEANFIVTESESDSGGFDFKILKYDANDTAKKEMVHKIVLELSANCEQNKEVATPVSSGGGSAEIGGPTSDKLKGLNPAPYR